MPFQKGNRANPGGRPKDKPWADALRMEIAAAGEDNPRALRKIAQKVLDLAASGDMQAIREIGDRLDGKPVQENQTELTHRYVARVPEKAPDATEWQKTYSPDARTIQ